MLQPKLVDVDLVDIVSVELDAIFCDRPRMDAVAYVNSNLDIVELYRFYDPQTSKELLPSILERLCIGFCWKEEIIRYYEEEEAGNK